MAIETKCTGCGKTLRVAEEHAGKLARCPACNTIYTVPRPVASAETASGGAAAPPAFTAEDEATASGSADSGAADTSDATLGEQWYLRSPENRTYGPVSRATLDGWASQGRVAGDCELRCGEDADWRPAVVVYPELGTKSPPVVPSGNPFADSGPAGGSAHSPVTSGAAVASGRSRYVAPHRGGLILTLGILGWVTCPILSIMAWVMGTSDLREMRRGRIDPDGMGLTQAGQILGMVYSLIWIAIAMIVLLIMVLAVAAGA